MNSVGVGDEERRECIGLKGSFLPLLYFGHSNGCPG
jgi:hypothetical protein